MTLTTADPMTLTDKPRVECYPATDDSPALFVVWSEREDLDGERHGNLDQYASWPAAFAAALWQAQHPGHPAPPRECPDVASVECVGCGRTVTDPTGIDTWNGYGDGPCACDPHDTPTRWTTYAGTWQVILDGRVLDSGTPNA